MKHAILILALGGLVAQVSPQPPGNAGQKKEGPAANQPSQKHTYLGVRVESLPPGVAKHLPTLPAGQGLLVMGVLKDSPAEKAGIKAHDILLTFGDQKLYSAEQLHRLVRADTSGKAVMVDYIRDGKPSSCKVALAERTTSTEGEDSRVYRFFPEDRFQHLFEELEGKKGSTVWESFDSLKLTRVDTKRWKAEVDYRSKDGKKIHKDFEGSRDDIRKQIMALKDLTSTERHDLLRALHFHSPIFEFRVPSLDSIGPDSRDP